MLNVAVGPYRNHWEEEGEEKEERKDWMEHRGMSEIWIRMRNALVPCEYSIGQTDTNDKKLQCASSECAIR